MSRHLRVHIGSTLIRLNLNWLIPALSAALTHAACQALTRQRQACCQILMETPSLTRGVELRESPSLTSPAGIRKLINKID